MYLFDRPAHTVTTLIVYEDAGASWHVSMNTSPNIGFRETSMLMDALEHGAAKLPRDCWLATRTGCQWQIETAPEFWLERPDEIRLSRTLGMLAALQVSEAVQWTKVQGFQPRAGALGLRRPRGEYVLRWPDGLTRRIVIGAPTPFGAGVMLFDGLGLKADGEHHPLGLYLKE